MRTLRFILFIITLSASIRSAAQEPEIILDSFRDEKATVTSNKETVTPDIISNGEQIQPVKTGKSTKWHFGITAGYTHSGNEWMITASGALYNYSEHTLTSPGFTVGGMASLPIDQVFSFDTGLNISSWGSGFDISGVSTKFNRYMLEVPTLITFFEPDALVPVFVQLGFVTGIYLGGTHTLSSSWQNDVWNNRKSRDMFSKITFGIAVGLGYGPVSFQFTQNVTGSMSNRFRRAWEENTGGTIDSHNAWSVTLAYSYWF